MGDVEEVDEGLHISSLEEVGADALPVIILVFFAVDDQVAHLLFEPLLFSQFIKVVVLTANLVEQNGWT